MAKGKILLIDDDIGIRGFLQDFFEDRDFVVQVASDGEEGLVVYAKGPFDLVLCDMLMPKMLGIEVLRKIKAANPAQKIIMMTGISEASMVEKAKALDCHLYLVKPVKLTDLEARVAECFPENLGKK